MRLTLLPILLAAAVSAQAQAADIPALLHKHQFAEAEARAADYADPIARKLVLFAQLLTPGAATPAQIADFLTRNPEWPDRALLLRRRDDALAKETDDAEARGDCTALPPRRPAALARCAEALKATDPAQADADARLAWAGGIEAPGFRKKWKSVLRPEDELARFWHFVATDSKQAAAQIAHLAPADRRSAKVLLGLRSDESTAYRKYQALPKADRTEPHLVLAALRWLRRAGKDKEAVTLWRSGGEAAEQASAARPTFWAERDALARDVLAKGEAEAEDAEWLADDRLQTAPVPAAASAFLAGFISLTALHKPKAAEADFQRLAGLGKAAITQARAGYWLGRARVAAGEDPHAAYARAAAYPLTFYGQLALHALGDSDAAITARIRALADPPAPTAVVWQFAGNELVRAAAILASWGQFGRARVFLLREQELSRDPRIQALAARFGLALGLPATAVTIARRMGVEGHALPAAGWPAPYAPPSAPPAPALVLAMVRQESSFDAGTVSPAGARGLMQLMPATAEAEARRAGASVTAHTLTADPARNMRLGAAYLRRMLVRFGGCLPLAVAAYNAGPHRVEQWLKQNGDPRTGKPGMIDWIELIPFSETRNYVERVLESFVVYQARLDQPAGRLTAQWMR